MTQPLVLHAAEETLEAVHTRRHAAYPAYKPSDVEWLGDVPEHWDVKRLKFLAHLVNAKVEADEETTKPYIGMEHIESWTGKLRLPDDVFVPTGASNIFRSGDVLFGKLRPYLAKATTVDFDGLCSSELMVFRSEGMDRHFLLYALLSDGFIKLVNSSTYGSKMPRANWEFIGGMLTPAPPLEEQQAITRFLDEQARKIDDLIEAKRSLLDLLKEKRQAVITHAVTRGLDPAAKLKPSGVKWLGDVPERWDIPPLYARYDAVLGKMLDEKRLVGESLVPYLRNIDVQWDHINTTDLPEMDIALSDYERFTVREGDLLVCEGGEVGRCAIWKSQLPLCGFQKAIHRLRARSSQDIPRFLFYVFRCVASYGAFIAGGNPNTIPHLTGEKLRRHRFPMPPVEEQQEIVRFLEEETERIDDLESVVREAIETLELLRAGIISAAVTGKIDVREEGV